MLFCTGRNLFEKKPHRSLFLRNSIIRAYAQVHDFGGRKSLSLDGSTKTIPRLQGSNEGLNITRNKIVSSRSLKGGVGISPSEKTLQLQALCFQVYRMSCFLAKVMATVVAVFLLVGGIHIPPTSASLPYGGRKSLSLDGLMKTAPRLQGSYEGLNIITGKKIVPFRSLREGISAPPSPVRNGSPRSGPPL
ncbi:hypothetical protein FH972_019191 [Carpinus fangiana]|uniref:Uncharacterized protein n=1 Tax=Carpinus fangiana TaxID=176857 RepID=A0A5N6RPU7_9ROSI|nr:hypothetical protein FH972_019191 [Carpinus fangiana]